MTDEGEQQLSYNEMLQIQQSSEYKYQKDRYVGQIDPVTKLRQGEGTYTYHENPYFQYQGSYHKGVKHSESGNASTLIMRDGTKFTGQFQNGEIQGYGIKTWPDGRCYEGQFHQGEIHGSGLMTYAPKSRNGDKHYEGQFNLNSREGEGILTKLNGDIFEGSFSANHPNGMTVIYFADGNNYEGEVINGVMTGQGFLQCQNGKCYSGQFKDGKLNGEGKYFVKEGTYSFESSFIKGEPEIKANKLLVDIISPVPEVEEVTKGQKKADPKKGAPQTSAPEVDEGIPTNNEIKVVIDNSNPNEDQKKLTFKIQVVYQGEQYEDPNPPEIDEAAKKKAVKGKEAEEPEVRMIIPQPKVMDKENGRTFKIELGRYEYSTQEDKDASYVSGQADGQKSSLQTNSKDKDTANKNDTKLESQMEEEEREKRWVSFKLDHSKDDSE